MQEKEKKKKTLKIKLIYNYKEKMAEWFKAADCKSVEFLHRRFKSYFFHL